MRVPAKVVSCPHCSWKGSARGLFTHCRMAHPHLPMPETRSIRVQESIHPQNKKISYKIKESKDKNFDWKVELVTICLEAILKSIQPEIGKKVGFVPRIDESHLYAGFDAFRKKHNKSYLKEIVAEISAFEKRR